MKSPAPDVTPLLRAIEAARFRMSGLTGIHLAAAAAGEMTKILEAKNAYDDEVAALQTKRVLDLVFPDGVPK